MNFKFDSILDYLDYLETTQIYFFTMKKLKDMKGKNHNFVWPSGPSGPSW